MQPVTIIRLINRKESTDVCPNYVSCDLFSIMKTNLLIKINKNIKKILSSAIKSIILKSRFKKKATYSFRGPACTPAHPLDTWLGPCHRLLWMWFWKRESESQKPVSVANYKRYHTLLTGECLFRVPGVNLRPNDLIKDQNDWKKWNVNNGLWLKKIFFFIDLMSVHLFINNSVILWVYIINDA